MTQAQGPIVPGYGSYLQLETLLSCQRPPDYPRLATEEEGRRVTRGRVHHDELLFIVVHQVFELWFKVVLAEMRLARNKLGRLDATPRPAVVEEEEIPRIVAAMARINEILQLMTHQWRIMETMNPTAFLDFRDFIIPASGFQSVQFRELEILAGLPDSVRLDFEGTPYETKLSDADSARLERTRGEMTLRDSLLDWLARTPIEEAFPGFAAAYLGAFEHYIETQVRFQESNPNLAPGQRSAAAARLRKQTEEARRYLLGGDDAKNRAHQSFVFMASYRTAPLLRWPSTLIEAFVEFEQGFRIFRFRHARMVERMIGARTGTGGSPGVGYLDHTTSRYRIFGDLLEARTFLLPASQLPPLPNADAFAFRRKA